MEEKIRKVQSLLKEKGVDGWLLYDFGGHNSLVLQFLEIPEEIHLTRRLFYWIPAKGIPVKIVHATEAHVGDLFPGTLLSYFKSETLNKLLKQCLEGSNIVAMEYYPGGAIPSLSLVDGGTLDLVRETVPSVVSSYFLLEPFLSILNEAQKKSHFEAAEVLDRTAELAWNFIRTRLTENRAVTEYDVQQYIADRIAAEGCVIEGLPICAVNDNCSNPHYRAEDKGSREIRKGDFILIDLWCKKKTDGAVFADITRVAVADTSSSLTQEKIFAIVYEAQKAATDLVKERMLTKETVKGYELDRAAREVIEKAGFGEYFVHRTGHNIYTAPHGPGPNLDSVETFDERVILPRTCFSVEPGIYLPGQFGVRLEYDIYITEEFKVQITGGIQKEIKTLF